MKNLQATITSDRDRSETTKSGDTILQVYLYRGDEKVGYVMLTANNIVFTEYQKVEHPVAYAEIPN